MLRKRRGTYLVKFFSLVIVVGVIALLFFSLQGMLQSSDEKEAVNVVKEFYTYEQEGDFGSSWELFHSQMKEKYKKPDYVQARAHVFMQHFGTNTFKFKLSEPESNYDVQLIEGKEILGQVYVITVTQTYYSSFGNFQIVQPVYAAEESGDWKVLWTFQKGEEF